MVRAEDAAEAIVMLNMAHRSIGRLAIDQSAV